MSSVSPAARAPLGVLAAVLLFAAGAALAAARVAVTLNPAALYPEGPLLRAGTLYYAEMGADRVSAWDGQANRIVWTRPGCGPTSVADGGGGTLLVLCHRLNAVARITLAGETREIVSRDAGGRPFVNPNASINDAKGGTYFSSSGIFAPHAPAEGAVLYIDAGGRVTRVAEDIHYANGVALTADGGTLYVSEHLARRVLAFTVGADGRLSDQRDFVALDAVETLPRNHGWELGPDGLAVDREGNVYIAEYGAGHLLIVGPNGKLRATIPVGEPYVTAMALSPDETEIYVTAPRSFFDAKAPGKVYRLPNPVAGD